MEPPPFIAIAGLPGSGKSTLMRGMAAEGYLVLDDMREDWDGAVERLRAVLAEGGRVVASDVMFCEASWRAQLALAAGREPVWLSFANDPWQCAVNCLFRLMVERDDRPLMDMLHLIAELSPAYEPPGLVHPIAKADARLVRAG